MIDLYYITAIDRFDRVFTSVYAIDSKYKEQYKFNYESWIFEQLVREILRAMGEEVDADWRGKVEHLDENFTRT